MSTAICHQIHSFPYSVSLYVSFISHHTHFFLLFTTRFLLFHPSSTFCLHFSHTLLPYPYISLSFSLSLLLYHLPSLSFCHPLFLTFPLSVCLSVVHSLTLSHSFPPSPLRLGGALDGGRHLQVNRLKRES